MNVQKAQEFLLKQIFTNQRAGAVVKDRGLHVVVIDGLGHIAFRFHGKDFHLSAGSFSDIGHLPFRTFEPSAETLLTDTGKSYSGTKVKAMRIFERNGQETYIDSKLLTFFDKSAQLYQNGNPLQIIEVVEGGEIVGYVMPCRAPEKETENN